MWVSLRCLLLICVWFAGVWGPDVSPLPPGTALTTGRRLDLRRGNHVSKNLTVELEKNLIIINQGLPIYQRILYLHTTYTWGDDYCLLLLCKS